MGIALISKKNRALAVSAISQKVKRRVPSHQPCADLFFSVFETALLDIVDHNNFDKYVSYRSAVDYLKSDIIHLELMGIDANWVKRIIRKVGFSEV